jgi:hypothetical protein
MELGGSGHGRRRTSGYGPSGAKLQPSPGAPGRRQPQLDGRAFRRNLGIHQLRRVQVHSKAEAVQWASRFLVLHQQMWPGWEGEVEIREVFGPEDFAPPLISRDLL